MIRPTTCVLICTFLYSTILSAQQSEPAKAGAAEQSATQPALFTPPTQIFGFRTPAAELKAEKTFLAVPDPKLAKEI